MNVPRDKNTYIVHQINNQSVRQCDTQAVCKLLSNLRPGDSAIETCRNSLVIIFPGFKNDDREIFEIPEICRYMKKMKEELPYLFFFLSLESEMYGQATIFPLFFIKYKRVQVQSGLFGVEIVPTSFLSFIKSEAAILADFCNRLHIENGDEKVSAILYRIVSSLGFDLGEALL